MPVLPEQARLRGLIGEGTLLGCAFLWSILEPLMLAKFAVLARGWPDRKVVGAGNIEKGP